MSDIVELSNKAPSIEEMTCVDQYPRCRDFISSENIPKRFSFSCQDKSEDAISVYVRIKPDESIHTKDFFSYDETESVVKLKKKEVEKTFKFTHIFGPDSTQVDIYDKCAKPALQRLLDGNNSFLFTYGVSSSGKTFTVQGGKDNPGIIPRTLASLFPSLKDHMDPLSYLCPEQGSSVVALSDAELDDKIAHKTKLLSLTKYMMPQISKTEGFVPFSELEEMEVETLKVSEQRGVYSVWLSFYEIYNEKVYELLDEPSQTKKPLRLMSDKDSTIYVKDLKHIQVNTLYEAFLVYSFGRFNLSINSTAVNDRSSRSHSVFTIKLVGKPPTENSTFFLNSSYSICDLAGTERAHKTQNVGARLREAQQINSSFLVLNRCLRIIRENQNAEIKKHVPYRDSKLTQILGRSFTSGETNLVMIVTISQNKCFEDETEGCLKNSSVATSIKAIPMPRLRSHKKMRFSMAISKCLPGRGADWNAVAQGKEIQYKDSPVADVYKELEDERKKRMAAEERLQEVLEEHRLEIDRLEEKLKKSPDKKNIKELERMLEEKEEEFMASRTEVLKLKKTIRLLKEDLDDKENKIKSLESTNNSYKEMLDDAKEEVEVLQEEIVDLEEIIKERNQIIALKNEKIESLELDRLELEENLKIQTSEHEKPYIALQDALNNLQLDYDELLKKYEVVKRELHGEKKLKHEVQHDNSQYQKQLQKAWEEIEGYKRHIETLESQMKSFEDNKRDMIKRFEALLEDKQNIINSRCTFTECKENKQEKKEKTSPYTLRAQNPPKIVLEVNSDDDSFLKQTPTSQKVKVLRTRSHDRRGFFSDSDSNDDPSFVAPQNLKSRTAVKKRARTKKQLDKNIPDYCDVSNANSATSSNAGAEPSDGKTRRKLFLRSSSDLPNPVDISRFDDGNQTESSPGTILKKTLRTGKIY